MTVNAKLSAAQQAAAVAGATAGTDDKKSVAAWLAAYQLSGIPVFDDKGAPLARSGEDPIGPAYWQVWMAQGLASPRANIRLSDLGVVLAGATAPGGAEWGGHLLDALRAGAAQPGPISFLARFVQARVRSITPSIDALADGTEADLVLLDAATAQLLSWAYFRTLTFVAAAGAEAFPPGSLRGPGGWRSTVARGPAPVKCSELFGDEDVTSWVVWAAGKVAGGVDGVPFLPGLAGPISKQYPEWAQADVAKKAGLILAAVNMVAGILTLIMQKVMFDVVPSADTLPRSDSTRPGAMVPVRFDLIMDPSKLADGDQAFLCAASVLLNALGIGFTIPPGGPVKGAELILEGRQGFGQGLDESGSFVTIDANDLKQITDDQGSATARITGRGQKRDRTGTPRTRNREYSLFVEAQPGAVGGQQLINMFIDSFTVVPSGGIGAGPVILDVVQSLHWDFGEYFFPLTDVDPGWVIDDVYKMLNSAVAGHYLAKSCKSVDGPWHIVVEKPADAITFNTFYDITINSKGIGTLTGEEHSTWSHGYRVDATYLGRALLRQIDDSNYEMTLDYDLEVTIVDPVMEPIYGPGPQHRNQHHTKVLKVREAADGEC